MRLDIESSTELRFETPPSPTAGPKAVNVINPDGQDAVLSESVEEFTYNPAPTMILVVDNPCDALDLSNYAIVVFLLHRPCAFSDRHCPAPFWQRFTTATILLQKIPLVK